MPRKTWLALLLVLWWDKPPGLSWPGDKSGDLSHVLIRCGATDTAGRTWKGSIEAASGDAEVVTVEGYHFLPADRVRGTSWEFATRPWTATFQQVDLSPARPGPRAVFPNGVYATVRGGAAARFRLTLNGEAHSFSLADLAGRKMLTLGGGNIEVELVPTQAQLSDGQAEADFPALAAGQAGRLALAWQEFSQDKDRIVSREFNGSAWSRAEITDQAETRDVFRPSVAYDGAGTLHLVWPAQVNGNWDLYARRKTSAGWQPVERLTEAPGGDFFQQLVADQQGELWLAWQGFRQGQSDIFLKRCTAGKWGPEIRVSESVANDWEPAVAAAPDGTVWVAWDSYERGNYDIFLRPLRAGAPGPLRALTRSPRFQAHVSLAASRNGLWIAFDEAEVNWGKDYGYLVKDRGNPLYQSRRLRVLRLAGDRVDEPEAAPASAFPLAAPDFLQYAHLAVASDGRPTVVATQLSDANRVIEVWGARGVWELVAFTLGPGGWRRHQILPRSAGPHEMRAAAASDATGRVWVAWAADSRNFGAAQPHRQTIHAAALIEEPIGGPTVRLKAFEEPDELAFATHPAETASVKAVRAHRIRSGGKEYRILRGDLHRHTTLSADGVGDGSLWDFYRYMLDAAAMDFATVTDHQGGGTEYSWWKTQKSADLFHMPGRLASIYAYERSVLYPNGHRNIVFPKRGAPVLAIYPAEQKGARRSAEAVLPYLRKYGAIAFRHTIATNQGTDWSDHDNELEPLVEIYQGHRVAYEHEGGPKGATAEKGYLHRSGYQPSGFFWNALAKGYRMGIQAASDHCSTHISYSSILAEGDSREAILDAMRKRHSYGATDNIILDFRVQAGGREYVQGDEASAGGRYTLVINAIGTGPIRRVDVIRNEHYVYAVTPTGRSAVKFTYADPAPAPGENRYYVRVQQEDGNLAWSSPVWVKAK